MSNMVVRTNVLALNSHRNLGMVGTQQARSSARLSSGFRINSAADDAAGLGISEKMRAQIRGLNQASRNAQDGISLIQTAEGAMGTINEMVNRIRELVVQASNDTNVHDANAPEQSDRVRIQQEIDQLIQEIDDTVSRTQFNTRTLLDGSLASCPLQGTSAANVNSWLTENAALVDAIDQAEVNLAGYVAAQETAQATFDDYTAVRDKAVTAAAALQGQLTAIRDTIQAGLNDGTIPNTAASDALALQMVGDLETALGLTAGDLTTTIDDFAALTSAAGTATNHTSGIGQTLANAIANAGTSHANWAALNTGVTSGGAQYTALTTANTNVENGETALEDAVDAANLALSTPNSTDPAAEAIRRELFEVFDGDVAAMREALEAYNAGESGQGLWFQIGANVGQGVRLNIESVSTSTLGIGNGNGVSSINVLNASGEEIQEQIQQLDLALAHTTSVRSSLGAMQNRLEFTIENLDIASENLSASESRIRDADMAAEMMRLTQANVLQQAATSMLAQANQAPNNILQLLG